MKKKSYARYSDSYCQEALALADRLCVAAAGHTLESALSVRSKAQQQQGSSERERALAEENACLKRQLAKVNEGLDITKKAAVYFAKSLK